MIGAYDRGVWAIPLATLVGKPVGVLAAAGLCVAVGLHLPDRVGWRELIVIGIVASLGLTMALFFAGVSMAPGQMLGEVKMGVIVSLAGVPLAFLAARLLRVGRYGR
jgi:NhaA family Na+:H+ antiporter